MRLSALTGVAVAATLCAACGGNTYSDAAPNLSTVAFDMESSDVSTAEALGDQSCHPHLFDRTREVVGMINHHLWKGFGRLDPLLGAAGKLGSGDSRTWTRSIDGDTITATIAKSADGSYTLTVTGQQGSAAAITLVSGTFTPAADGTPHAGSGTINIDLSAITQLDPAEVSSGQLAVTYTINGASKVVQVQATNFQPDDVYPVRPPRDAFFVYARTNKVGGSLKFSEGVELFCPPNPTNEIASVETVARWAYINGEELGRADSLGTGGQIPSGDQWMGLTCFNMDRPDADAETYWQMKEENGSGTVIQTQDAYASDSIDPTSTCNAAFGPVPSLTTNANDFDFGSINFTDSSVVPYPGEPSGS